MSLSPELQASLDRGIADIQAARVVLLDDVLAPEPRIRRRRGKAEVQLDRHHRSSGVSSGPRWTKRQQNRLERREARRDPENAPTRRQFRGYE